MNEKNGWGKTMHWNKSIEWKEFSLDGTSSLILIYYF